LYRVLLIILVTALSACASQKNNSNSNLRLQSEFKLELELELELQLEREQARLELDKHKKIILMTLVPNRYCHQHMAEKYQDDFNKELGFVSELDDYFNGLFIQELATMNVSVEVMNPIEYFGQSTPLFSRAFYTEGGLKLLTEIKDLHKKKLEYLVEKNNAALLVMLYINESSHGKKYRDDCYGIKYATKTMKNLKSNYIHSPSWGVYSLKSGKNIEWISANITNGIPMPENINNLTQEYKVKILNLLEDKFRKEITRGVFTPRKVDSSHKNLE